MGLQAEKRDDDNFEPFGRVCFISNIHIKSLFQSEKSKKLLLWISWKTSSFDVRPFPRAGFHAAGRPTVKPTVLISPLVHVHTQKWGRKQEQFSWSRESTSEDNCADSSPSGLVSQTGGKGERHTDLARGFLIAQSTGVDRSCEHPMQRVKSHQLLKKPTKVISNKLAS